MLNIPEKSRYFICKEDSKYYENVTTKHLYAMYNSDTFFMTACGHNTKGEESHESYVASFFRHP